MHAHTHPHTTPTHPTHTSHIPPHTCTSHTHPHTHTPLTHPPTHTNTLIGIVLKVVPAGKLPESIGFVEVCVAIKPAPTNTETVTVQTGDGSADDHGKCHSTAIALIDVLYHFIWARTHAFDVRDREAYEAHKGQLLQLHRHIISIALFHGTFHIF